MHSQLRVMLADDHAALRHGLRALLETELHAVVVDEVSDVPTALEAVRRLQPDVLILDLSMPTQGGLAALPQIASAHRGTAVVVFTRHRDLTFAREAMDNGACSYVLKQSPIDELWRGIASAVQGERYVDASLREAYERLEPHGAGRASHREEEVLRRTALGESNKDIATALGISVRTVEVHKTHGMRKLRLPDRAALMRYAVVQGWLVDC